jgi:TRAP-type uncharacterized transport system substrate-binding protein
MIHEVRARHVHSHTEHRHKEAQRSPPRTSAKTRRGGGAAPAESPEESSSSSPAAVDESEDSSPAGTPAPVTVTILAGDVDGTAARIAADISDVLDSDDMRVMPVLGKGSVQNLRDITSSPYLDLTLVSSDALNQAKRSGLSNLDSRVSYIAPLFKEEVQILARGDIETIGQLDGKKIGVDVAGSAASDRASSLFRQLGLQPDLINFDQPRALSLLQRGALDAVVFVGGKPIPALASLPPQSGLHFVAIPYEGTLQDSYYPARLDSRDYPNLLGSGSEVSTIATGTILAAYDAPEGSPRYRKLAKFTDAFFRKFNNFLQPGRHPKWQEVNFAADAPGWRRFKPAQDWLNRAENTAATAGDAR